MDDKLASYSTVVPSYPSDDDEPVDGMNYVVLPQPEFKAKKSKGKARKKQQVVYVTEERADCSYADEADEYYGEYVDEVSEAGGEESSTSSDEDETEYDPSGICSLLVKIILNMNPCPHQAKRFKLL